MPEIPDEKAQHDVTQPGATAQSHARALGGTIVIDEELEQLKARSREYIDRVWTHDRICPICGSEDWGVSETSLLPLRAGPTADSPPDFSIAFPIVPVNCQICGYTIFFNEKWVRAGGTPPELVEMRQLHAEEGA